MDSVIASLNIVLASAIAMTATGFAWNVRRRIFRRHVSIFVCIAIGLYLVAAVQIHNGIIRHFDLRIDGVLSSNGTLVVILRCLGIMAWVWIAFRLFSGKTLSPDDQRELDRLTRPDAGRE